MEPLLSICQEACYEVGIVPPSTIVNNSDPAARLLKALANKSLDAVATEGEWPQLVELGSITLVASQLNYAVPSDWWRTIGDTEWLNSELWPLYGPITHEEWMTRQYGTTADPVRSRYLMRERGPKFQVQPTPDDDDAGDYVYYRYISTNLVSTTANAFRSTFAADTDAPVLDDDLIRQELIWRLREQKGLEFMRHKQEAEKDRRDRLGDYIGYGTINMLGRRASDMRFVGVANIPDTVTGV